MESTSFLLKTCLLLALINGACLQRPLRYNRQSQRDGTIVRFEETPECTSPSNEKGTCIVLRNCEALVPLLRQGQSDLLRKSICGYDGLEPKVCCPRSTPTTTSTTQLPPSVPESEEKPECGFSNVTHGKVVGGTKSQKGAWPWLAALAYRKKDSNASTRFLCGGALITPRHILTAGHCIHRRKDLYAVRLGEHDIKSENDGANPIDMNIEEKILHPGYNPTTYQNDIGIIRLAQPVEFNNEIYPICLPQAEELRSMTFTRHLPYVAGWGAVKFNGPSSSELREVQMPVVDPAKCKKAYTNFRTTVIDERVMCAGFARGGRDACQGDSGGPLMWPRGERFYAIGVVSYGFKCAEPGYPGVYTRVTAYLDWINSVIGS